MNKKKLSTAIDRFEKWYLNQGELSYDRMDYWSSNIGIWSKKIYYHNKILGIPFAGAGLLFENFFPNVQKIFSHPHREVIGDAHYAMSYMNLYEISGNNFYLLKAENLLNVMKGYASSGYSGLCWGYSFNWQQSKNVLWSAGTPMITITPYAFWAYKKHYILTSNSSSYDICLSIADHALSDLNEIQMDNSTVSSSYSPHSQDIVINANSYRAAVLLEAYQLSKDKKYKQAAENNINFILSFQGSKGEWFYEAKGPENNFIDHFHTCFVLKNMYKCYQVTEDNEILHAIQKGYKYYNDNLFYPSGRPKHFSVAKYIKLRKYEMYDYAESISLGILLRDIIPESYGVSVKLANDLIENFQKKDGSFITRVTSFGTKHKVPYHRWPQSQLFYALTSLLKCYNENEGTE
jgi:hypothetical protein